MTEINALSLVSIQYELILSLGRHDELLPMLSRFMRACIKRIGVTRIDFYYCKLFEDWENLAEEEHKTAASPVLSIPRHNGLGVDGEDLLEIAKTRLSERPCDKIIHFQQQEENLYAIPIPPVGILLIQIKKGELAPEFVSILEQISPTLIASCKSCLERDRLRQEVERRKQAEAKLQASKRQAELNSITDHLTDLPNRRAFASFLDSVRHDTHPRSKCFGILQVDLDNFKRLNDRHGHAAGDAVLCDVARILRSSLRNSDFVARMGGDEFAIVVKDAPSPADLKDLAERLIARISEIDRQESYRCELGASIGISHATSNEMSDLAGVMSHADEALYEAKRAGRNRYCFFDRDLRAQNIKRTSAIVEIKEALDRGDFVPYFQPQICSLSGDIIGVEALARWNHPVRGLIPPARFISLAEDVGLLDAIDARIFELSFAAMMRLDEQGLHLPKIGLNITASKLCSPSWLEHVVDSLNHFDLDAERIAFEIVESIIFDDDRNNLADAVKRSADVGFQIQLDDFGTGHASLSTLRLLPLSCVKIDKTFVRNIDADPDLRRLTEGIIGLIHGSKMAALAEGVETHQEADTLKQLGANYLQGYRVARPMPESDLRTFLYDHSRALMPPLAAA
ncbi:MAG: putative bifunctional diguanylate cyclase/phosphodiesterase [Geminicoccaceae bacterium]